MEKTKVKQVIREALAREPAIEWYLKSKKIYGHYVTLLALVSIIIAMFYVGMSIHLSRWLGKQYQEKILYTFQLSLEL